MDETYLQKLYDWINQNDNTFSSDVPFGQFVQKMQDDAYAKKMHDWIGSMDNTFTQDLPFDAFKTKIRGGAAQTPPVEKKNSVVPSATPQEVPTEEQGTTESSLDGTSSDSSSQPNWAKLQEQRKYADVPQGKGKPFQLDLSNIKPKETALPEGERKYIKEGGFKFKNDKTGEDYTLANSTNPDGWINENYGQYGFTAKRNKSFGGIVDDLTITNPQGKSITVPINNFSTSKTNASLIKIEEFIKNSPKYEKPKEKEPIPKRIIESIESIDSDLVNGTEEYAVPKLNYQFGDLGFTFEESGATGDWVTITAPNGKTTQIGLNPLFGMGADNKAKQIRDFIVKNMPSEITHVEDGKEYKGSLAEIESKFAAQRKKYNTEQEFSSATADFNRKASAFQADLQNLLKLSPASKEYVEKKAILDKARNELALEAQFLEANVGKYATMKSSQGTWYGDLGNMFLEGAGEMVTGGFDYLLNAATNIRADVAKTTKSDLDPVYIQRFKEIAKSRGMSVPEGLTDEEFKDWSNSIAVGEDRRDEIDAIIRDEELKGVKYGTAELGDERKGVINTMRTAAKDVFGDANSTLEYSELASQSFWRRQMQGIAKMAPSMITTGWAGKTAGLFTQISDGINKEMQNNPEFANISENEKMSIALPIAAVNAVIMEAGLSKVLSGEKGILSTLIGNTLAKTAEKATVEEYKYIAKNELKEMISRGLISMANSSTAGFVTGAEIKISEDMIKDTYNSIKQKKMFETPEDFKSWGLGVLESGVNLAAGAMIMAIPSAVHAAATETGYRGMDDASFKMFEMASKDDASQKLFIANLKNQINTGKITGAQGKEILNSYRNSVGLLKSMPEQITNIRDKKVAMDLLKEKRDLERMKEGKDDALTKPIRDRIESIDQQLSKITENAIQEQRANEGLLRAGEERLGLQPMGEGDTQLEVTPEQQKVVDDERAAFQEILDNPDNHEPEDVQDAKDYFADPVKYYEGQVEFWEKEVKNDPSDPSNQEALDNMKELLQAHKAAEVKPKVEGADNIQKKYAVELRAQIRKRLRQEGKSEDEINKLTGTSESPIIDSVTSEDISSLINAYKNNKAKQLENYNKYKDKYKPNEEIVPEIGEIISDDTSFWDNNINELSKLQTKPESTTIQAGNGVTVSQTAPEATTSVTIDEIENNRKLDLAEAKDAKERQDINDYYDNLVREAETKKEETKTDTEDEGIYYKSGKLKGDYIKQQLSKAMNEMSFRKFANLYRKHFDNTFSRKSNLKSNGGQVDANFTFRELANYIIGDGYFDYEDSDAKFRAFAKDAGIEIPENLKSEKTETKTSGTETTGTEPIKGTTVTIKAPEPVGGPEWRPTDVTMTTAEETETAGVKKKPVMERDEVKKEIPAIMRAINKAMDAGKEFAVALKESSAGLIKTLGEKYRSTIENALIDRFNKGADEDITTHPDYEKVMEDIDLEARTTKESNKVVKEAYEKRKAEYEDYKDSEGYEKNSRKDLSLKKKLAKAKQEIEDYKTFSEQSKNKSMELLVNSEMYKTSTDTQKENLVRDLLERFGEKQKSAPTPEELFGNVVGVKELMDKINFLFGDANKSKDYLEKKYNKAKEAFDKDPKNDKLRIKMEKAKAEVEEYKTKNIEEAKRVLQESELYKKMSSVEYEQAASEYEKYTKSDKYKQDSAEDKRLRKKIENAQKEIDARKQKMLDYINEKFETSQKSTISPTELFGNIKDVKKVSMTEKSLLTKQIRDLARGAKDLDTLTKKLSENLRKLITTGKITAAQASRIIGKLAKIDKSNPEEIKKFVEYATKVFKDAEYDEKIAEANKSREVLSSLVGGENKDPYLKKLAKSFLEIKPSMVENLDAYNDMATKIKESLKGSKAGDKNTPVRAAEVVNVKEANKYIEQMMKEQKENMIKERMEDVLERLGFDATGLTIEQMDALLKEEKADNKYTDEYKKAQQEYDDYRNSADYKENSPEDIKLKENMAQAKLDAESRKKQMTETIIRDKVKEMFDSYSSIIKKMITTGKDPFTGDPVDISKSKIDILKKFMGMDLDNLDRRQAIEAMDSLTNFIQNGSTANMETVVRKYQAKENIKVAIKRGLTASPLRQYFNEGIGRLFANQLMSMPILFEKMFNGNTGGLLFEKLSGFSEVKNAKTFVDLTINKMGKEYTDKFYYGKKFGVTVNKKANGKDFNHQSNVVERGFIASLKRTIQGTPEEQQAEFNKKKKLLEQSQKELEKGTQEEKKIGAVYKEVYDKVLKDSDNIDDVIKKSDAKNVEAVDWWINKWDEIFDQLADVSENVYNEVLDKDVFYTPDKYSSLFERGELPEVGLEGSLFHNNSGLYDEKTGVLIKRKDLKDLPKERYLDVSFDRNQMNAMKDALMDIHTAGAIKQMNEFFNSEGIDKIIPSKKDKALLYNSSGKGRIQEFVRKIRNKSIVERTDEANTLKRINAIGILGTSAALGGIAQWPKQFGPPALNTLITNNGDLSGFGALIKRGGNQFLDRIGYGISVRGLGSTADIASINKILDLSSKSVGSKAIGLIGKANKWWLETFLKNADVGIARISWLSYYEAALKKEAKKEYKDYKKSSSYKEGSAEDLQLKKNIENTKNIDYRTHKLNTDAADYAEKMVNRQQNISDTDLQGRLLGTNEPWKQVLTKIAIPFASFRFNQTMRIMTDLHTLKSEGVATSEDRALARKSLAGYLTEMAAFNALSGSISNLLGDAAANLMGVNETDEEKKKRHNQVWKGRLTNATTDMLSPVPQLDWITAVGVDKAMDMVQSLAEVKEDDRYGLMTKYNADVFRDLGVLGVGAARINDLIEASDLVVTGKYTDEYGREKYISEKSRDGLAQLIPISFAANLGLLPNEATAIFKKSIKIAKKDSSTKPGGVEQAAEDAVETEQNKAEKAKTISNKTSVLRDMLDKETDQNKKSAIRRKIRELNMTKEEKAAEKEMRDLEKARKERLLGDYDTEEDLKRYDKKTYKENFGPNSDWYLEHKYENMIESEMNKQLQKKEDKEHNYRKKSKNSDGSRKRNERKSIDRSSSSYRYSSKRYSY